MTTLSNTSQASDVESLPQSGDKFKPYEPMESRGFRRTMSNALIITRREVRDSFRDWRIIAPIIILGWFSQKQLVRGLTFGAVK